MQRRDLLADARDDRQPQLARLVGDDGGAELDDRDGHAAGKRRSAAGRRLRRRRRADLAAQRLIPRARAPARELPAGAAELVDERLEHLSGVLGVVDRAALLDAEERRLRDPLSGRQLSVELLLDIAAPELEPARLPP